MKISEYIPQGWQLLSIAYGTSGYTVSLGLPEWTTRAEATDPDLDDALQLACDRAREFPSAIHPFLHKLTSVRRTADCVWVLGLADGTIAGHQSPVKALDMLGLLL